MVPARSQGQQHDVGAGSAAGLPVGVVAAIYRYPVKSMAAQPVESAEVHWNGLDGDRRWAFVQPAPRNPGFPWLTLRQRNDLNAYRPYGAVDGLRVRTPSGEDVEVTDPRLAQELGARAMKLDRGTFDTAPLSLISTRSVKEIGALAGRDADVLRFRPNLVVEPLGDDPFAEDSWVGGTLVFGTAEQGPVEPEDDGRLTGVNGREGLGTGLRMHVDRRDHRCVVVNIDPVTGERTPDVLRAVARHRDTCLGVYGSVAAPGAVSVGDPVRLLR
ncbi:MOSC domain-containing protein [Kineosporia succinea]|nr:MOSC N-terminal beta barrel domain-containing protein [Kineosporia succinea]